MGTTDGPDVANSSQRRALLPAGLATGFAALPHGDATAAAHLVLQQTPGLPSLPALPRRSVEEHSPSRWLRALPEVVVASDGTIEIDDDADPDGPLDFSFDPNAHAGILAFVDLAAKQPRPPARVLAQVTGPLTLGVALSNAGVPEDFAFPRASRVARGWARHLEDLVRESIGAQAIIMFDEPDLERWNDDRPPIDHDHAGDLLSGAFAAVGGPTGVNVGPDGDVRLALSAGPDILGVPVSTSLIADAAGLGRFLEGGGYISWGAVPTHRPVGESAAPLWKSLVDLWCELSRRGCDGLSLRTQAIISPASGLDGHGVGQAEHALALARELAGRVFDQAAATKLTVGA